MADFANDFRNIVIDRVIDGVAEAHDQILFRVDQVTNPALSCTSDSTDAVDALGIPITTFYRAKTAEFTAENALLDLDLAAEQFGTKREKASEDSPIVTPAYDTFTVVDGTVTYELSKVPTSDLTAIYALTSSGGLGQEYTAGTEASGTEFIWDADANSITIPDDIEAGTQIYVKYEYNSTTANSVKNTAIDFPSAFKFTLHVLCVDICDPTTLRSLFIVFPNAKLSPDVDLDFTTDGTHNFTINAQVDYCDPEKRLFQILVDEYEGDEQS